MSSPSSISTDACSAKHKPLGAYWLSFRVADDVEHQRSLEQRHDDLIKSLSRHISGKYWEKSTSFIVFESRSTIEQIAKDAKAAIDPLCDLFLLRKLDVKQARICGRNTDNNIYELIPYPHHLSVYAKFMRWVVDTRNRRVIQGFRLWRSRVIQGFRLWRSLDLDGGRPQADCGEHQRGTSAAVP
jgi:hypothetical protein